MAPNIASWENDGTISVLGGVNSAETPDLIEQSELAWAVNAELRGGKPHVRGAWIERAAVPFGVVQGMHSFDLDTGMIVISVGGNLHRITAQANNIAIDEITISSQRATHTTKVWMEQTTSFLVVQDGVSPPLIYDGVAARDAADDEVPIGKQMAYGNGRLAVAVEGRKLALGDINIGKGKGSELKFTEINNLSNGGTFTMSGLIRAMKFLPSNDNTTGVGALITGGVGWSSTVRADIPDRNEWLKTPGFISELKGLGFIGQPSVVTHNNDMYLRDDDGKIRKFRQAVADLDQAGSTSISQNIRRISDHEEVQFLESCPSMVVDGRMISAVSPYLVHEGQVAFRSMVSMDFAPESKISLRSSAIFDGEWQGFSVTHMSVLNDHGKKRGFAIGKDSDGNNRLYEYVPELRQDQYINRAIEDEAVNINPIQWELYYKAFTFKAPLTKKRYRRTDVWLSGIEGDVNIKLYFRSDRNPTWHLIDDVSRCANVVNACNADEKLFTDFESGVSDIITHEPEDAEGLDYIGFSFQIRLVIVGVCQVDQLMVWAENLSPNQNAQEEPLLNALPCQYKTVNVIANEYQIPTVGESTEGYVDENGVAYADEDAEEYIG